MSDIIAFGPEDDIEAHVIGSDDGPLVVFGAVGEKGVVMPLVMFIHLVGSVDEECSKIHIATEEGASATKH